MKLAVIANLCLGNFSSVLLDTLIALAIFGIEILYMLLFSKIAMSIFKPDSGVEAEKSFQESLLGSKVFYIVVLGLITSPFIVKKRI